MKNLVKTLAISFLAFSISSCSSEEVALQTTETSAVQNQTATGLIAIPTGVDENLVAVARRLTNALNAGNERDAQAAFADNAIFDSVGRIYNGSADIMGRFLTPEVIRARGRYREERITADPNNRNIITIQYDFRAPNYQERFTYAYEIRNGVIVNVLGRYL
jgi:hypothetical protein